jgi:hypothetical protein
MFGGEWFCSKYPEYCDCEDFKRARVDRETAMKLSDYFAQKDALMSLNKEEKV